MPYQLSKEELREGRSSRKEFLNLPRNEIYIVLDSLKVAHNIGTILRMADALLIKKVYICGDTKIPPNSKIKSSSRGANRWVDWEYAESAEEVVKKLKEESIEIVAIEYTDNSIYYKEYKPKEKVCLILGREDNGVSQELIELSDKVLHLPLLGMSNSINVASAASVIMYDVYGKMYETNT